MQAISHAPTVSLSKLWIGRIMSFLPALFLILDAVMKFVKPAFVVEANVQLGYGENVIVPLGAVLLVITILYLIPRTAVLGAILLTGYLGGAVATHVRVGAGVFPIVFAIVFGVLLWGGLYLRDPRVSALIPLSEPSA
ncbi:MAG TPA: DoxX family protein [Pyrinomonadaceae bacterium]|nr:DoxX family protein [Pyrinomonadaceae bacterium]